MGGNLSRPRRFKGATDYGKIGPFVERVQAAPLRPSKLDAYPFGHLAEVCKWRDLSNDRRGQGQRRGYRQTPMPGNTLHPRRRHHQPSRCNGNPQRNHSVKKHRGSAWAPVLDRVRAVLRDEGARPTSEYLLENVKAGRRRRRHDQPKKNHPITTAKKPAPCSYQKVISRRPVPFQPNPKKEPKHILCYIEETLKCGHTVTVYPGELEPLTARRRNCHDCAGWNGALKLPRRKANVIRMPKRA